jgi:hypothetical protein
MMMIGKQAEEREREKEREKKKERERERESNMVLAAAGILSSLKVHPQ